jgi:excisionase family DNA binding protein
MDGDALLTLGEAAKLLRIKVSTLRAWHLLRKNLSFCKIGGRVFIRRVDVDAFIQRSVITPELSGKQIL